MAIPPLPPLRIKEADGSPNVIPVIQITLSNAALVDQGGGKVLIDAGGSQGAPGAPGTVTIGSSITGGASAGFLLYVSGAVLGQINSGIFQQAITFPLSTGSGGTGRTTIGSAHTVLGVNSSEASLTYYAILASDNVTILKSGTAIYFSANTNAGGSSVVYAATGNKYAVLDLASDLTNEFRIVQSGNSITIDTTGNLVIINASTGNLSGKQDSVTFPLITGSGGTGLSTVGSALTILGMNSSAVALEYKKLTAGDNITITYQTTGITIAATTGGAGTGTVNAGSQNYLAYYPSAGTTVDDTTISISTANGTAPFNVSILTSAAASLASGDFWFQSSSNKLYLACRSSTTTYLVELGS